MCLIIRTQKLKSFYAAAPPALLCRKERAKGSGIQRFIQLILPPASILKCSRRLTNNHLPHEVLFMFSSPLWAKSRNDYAMRVPLIG